MASAQISETTRPAYLWSGSEWIPIGDGGGGGGSEIFYQSASPSTPAVGTLWVDEDGSVEDDIAGISHNHDLTYLSLNTASNTYLTINNASNTYATIVDLNNIDLTNTINTASAAAYSSASAYTDQQISVIDLSATIQTASAAAVNYLIDSAPGTLDTLNELSAALNDDPNFYSTIQSVYLTQSNASATYLAQLDANTIYLTQSSASTQYEKLIPYSSSAPLNPTEGDLWVDSTVPTIKSYISGVWTSVGGGAADSDQSIIASRMFTQ
jgi:hypothetical protein